jgi:hypothetical protein
MKSPGFSIWSPAGEAPPDVDLTPRPWRHRDACSGASYTFTVSPPPPGPVTVNWDPGAAIVATDSTTEVTDSRVPLAQGRYYRILIVDF